MSSLQPLRRRNVVHGRLTVGCFSLKMKTPVFRQLPLTQRQHVMFPGATFNARRCTARRNKSKLSHTFSTQRGVRSFLSSNHLDAWDFLPCSSWKKHEVFVYSKRIRDMKQEESLCTPKPHLFASELSHCSHLYDRFCAAETWNQVDVMHLSIIWLNWTDR